MVYKNTWPCIDSITFTPVHVIPKSSSSNESRCRRLSEPNKFEWTLFCYKNSSDKYINQVTSCVHCMIPIRKFVFGFLWKDNTFYQHRVVCAIAQYSTSKSALESLPTMASLHSPHRALTFTSGVSVKVLNNTALQILHKWNTSLKILKNRICIFAMSWRVCVYMDIKSYELLWLKLTGKADSISWFTDLPAFRFSSSFQ